MTRVQKPDGAWTRRHVHTLSGLLHQRAADANLDYRDFIRASRTLCNAAAARECFRRAVFNLVAGNRDDHGRNHAFRYDETTRAWSLTPAYDLTPSVANTLIGLSWMGSTAIPQRFAQVVQLAEAGGIDRKEAKAIYQSVENRGSGWLARSGKVRECP
ncbi:MAG: HipA domain-containing protein [Lacunisphaera sp.]